MEAERISMLADMFVGAMEHNGYGWFDVEQYHIPEGAEAEWFAVIREWEDEKKTYRITLDDFEEGLRIIRESRVDVIGTTRATHDDHEIEMAGYVHPTTGKSLALSDSLHDAIMIVDLTNGEDGDIDVIAYLAILEIVLFGEVVYA